VRDLQLLVGRGDFSSRHARGPVRKSIFTAAQAQISYRVLYGRCCGGQDTYRDQALPYCQQRDAPMGFKLTLLVDADRQVVPCL